MLERDFFVFCTSLKPVELKALGELSEIQHLGDSKIIYSPGDRAQCFYIVNRGMVEVVEENSKRDEKMVYLSRGDIFGDVEMLNGFPRRHRVRTCEFVSLQCFCLDKFPEIVKRVPRFFQYLSAHLAFRLQRANDLAFGQIPRPLELAGNLANFDLVTIYQTIVNSSQTGELSILNKAREAVCAFFFEEGQPRCGQFLHLTGEEAFWQLFLSEDMSGTFSFSTGERPISDWIQAGRLERHPGDLLINALQGRDEIRELKKRIPALTKLQRRTSELVSLDALPANLRTPIEQIWQMLAAGPATVSKLYLHGSFCELKIYFAVDELLKSGQIEFVSEVAYQEVA